LQTLPASSHCLSWSAALALLVFARSQTVPAGYRARIDAAIRNIREEPWQDVVSLRWSSPVQAWSCRRSPSQPMVNVWLHSTSDASPSHPNAAAALGAPAPAALLLLQILPVFSVVAPCRRGASLVSVRRQTFTPGCGAHCVPGRMSGRGAGAWPAATTSVVSSLETSVSRGDLQRWIPRAPESPAR